MDAGNLENLLRELALMPRSFTLQEVLDVRDPDVAPDALRQALLDDARFVVFSRTSPGKFRVISSNRLLSWFAHLNLRLAQSGLATLSRTQFANVMSSLRQSGRWDHPPQTLVDFGRRLGLVACGWKAESYVFPLAQLLIGLPSSRMGFARSVLEEFVRDPSLINLEGDSIERCLNKVLSTCATRDSQVVQRREGVFGGDQETLEQIGHDLGLTRERVWQIERRFWTKLSKDQALQLSAVRELICAIVRRQGSLVTCAEEWPLRFIAKCVSLAQAKVPHLDMVVLSATPEDFAFAQSLRRHSEFVDPGMVAEILDRGRLALSREDVGTICEAIARFCQASLSKAERVRYILGRIGQPAHYSKVLAEYNRLFPGDPSTERNILATLHREEHGVVWVGVRGVFALREWGYERPSEPLFDTVAEIVARVYKSTGRPVSFGMIVAEVGRYRQIVNQTSLMFAMHWNPKVKCISKDSFIPADPDNAGEETISDNELDRILREFEERC